MTALLARLRGGRAATLLTNMALLVSGVLTSVLISRALGPAGRGEYITWQTWAATIGIFALGGLPQVIVLDDWTPGRHKLAEIALPLGLALGFALVLVVGVAPALRLHLVVIMASVLAVMATQFAAVAPAEAQRMGRMHVEFNVSRILPQAAALVAMFWLLWTRSSSATTWFVAVSALQAVAMLAWLVVAADRKRSERASVRSTLKESVRLTVGNWVTLLQYRFDILAVTVLFDHETVAYYAVGVAAQSAVLAAGQASGMHWFSRRGKGQPNRRAKLRRELLNTVAVALAVSVPLAATSGLWIVGAYGKAFSPAVAPVVALCGVGVVQSLDYLLAHECLVVGRGGGVAWYRLPSVVVLALGFWLAARGSWPVTAIAAIPAVAYAVSSVTFFVATRTRAADATSAEVAPTDPLPVQQ